MIIEIKCTINVMCLNILKPFPTPVCGKPVFHKINPWLIDWGTNQSKRLGATALDREGRESQMPENSMS